MKHTITAFFLMLMVVPLSEADRGKGSLQAQAKRSLADWQWQYRVLLIDVRDLHSSKPLLMELSEHRQEMFERKLKVLLLNEHAVKEVVFADNDKVVPTHFAFAEIQKRLHSKSSILIGLDGGTKSFYDWPAAISPIDLMQVFADIDGMPMRRQEMQR